jgi:hypothetical protein
MNKSEITRLVKKLDSHMKAVAKERDRIDETIDQFEMLREDCINAYDCLQGARDALSEMV